MLIRYLTAAAIAIILYLYYRVSKALDDYNS